MHTLTVTKVADETNDDYEFTISGEHDYTCAVWRPCKKTWHRHPKNRDDSRDAYYGDGDTWSTKSVPQEHMWMYLDGESGWVVQTSECGLDLALEQGSPEFEGADELGATYAVYIGWDYFFYASYEKIPH